MSFAEKLIELRRKVGLTQQELAQAGGLSISAVRSYEQDTQEPSLRNAVKLARALGVSVEAFADCVEAPAVEGEAKRKRKGKKQ
jgi:transcriptional regulator with XRE-family HTH domain